MFFPQRREYSHCLEWQLLFLLQVKLNSSPQGSNAKMQSARLWCIGQYKEVLGLGLVPSYVRKATTPRQK